jgi:hypothetical protein
MELCNLFYIQVSVIPDFSKKFSFSEQSHQNRFLAKLAILSGGNLEKYGMADERCTWL